jgi:tRNA pseudouridine65 synthase
VDVIYRDEYIVAVNKPSGLIVHRGFDRDPITVADIVRDKIIGAPVHALHRLDRGTSGALVFALNSETARFLQTKLQDGSLKKRYLTLVRGPMKEACILDYAISNKEGGERVDASSEFIPKAHTGRWSLVEALPRTGRLHQIRRHLKHLSHHVVNDTKYGKGDVNRFFRDNYSFRRLALHCFELLVPLPDGQTVTLSAPLPSDFSDPLIRMGLLPSTDECQLFPFE